MKYRVLITGGMGFVGGRVAQTLAMQSDVEVILASRREQASPNWLPDVEVVHINWHLSESLAAACAGVDCILHLAGMNETDCALDPTGALEANGMFTIRLMEAAVVAGVSRFVYMSTAHIYGAPLTGRVDETSLPRPRHPYATSHKAAEDAVLAAHDNGRFTGIVLRLSNSFGAPTHSKVKRWTLLVNDLCRQAVIEQCLTLRSVGLQRRDFVTLHDVGRAINHVIHMPRDHIGNGVFNVGGDWSPRVIDMVEIIQARCLVVLGYRPEVLLGQPSEGEVTLPFEYCINKLKATGFHLQGCVDDEVDATLAFCQKTFGKNNG